METLNSLPDISGRRFGNITIGYDRVDRIRMEVSTLETLAALLCGCTREDLTLEKVQRLLADLQTRVATLTEDERRMGGDVSPKHLLAVAVAQLQAIPS